jgi:hypothetical protein
MAVSIGGGRVLRGDRGAVMETGSGRSSPSPKPGFMLLTGFE